MKTKSVGLVSVLGIAGCSVLGCSGSEPQPSCGDACAEVQAGAGGGSDPSMVEAGAGGDNQQGDDTSGAGEAPTAGGADGAAGEANEGGSPAAPEPSQWIVYLADDETPGENELYAIRVADLGQSNPVKISPDPGDHPWLPIAVSSTWSPDGTAYAFQNYYEEGGNDFYIVRFSNDGVEPPVRAASNFPLGSQYMLKWSPFGNAVLLQGDGGVVVAEPDAQGAYIGKKLGFPADGWVDAEWKDDNTIIHSVFDEVANSGALFISIRGQGSWVTDGLAYKLTGLQWSLSADRKTVAYSVENGPGERAIYASETILGSPQRPVEGSGTHQLYWFPTLSNFLLIDQGKVAWGTGTGTPIPTTIAGLELFDWDFSPDGSRLAFWEQTTGNFAQLALYDFAQAKTTTHEVLRNRTVSRPPLEWAPDGSSYVGTHQQDALADVDLVLGDAKTGELHVIDTGTNNSRFYYQFSGNGEFLAYDKEQDGTWESAYLDLRGGFFNVPPPVKVPGEKELWALEFEPGGSNAVLVHHFDNGAQTCSYLDLSRQVAKPPVQVSGEGRVQYCVLQPRAK